MKNKSWMKIVIPTVAILLVCVAGFIMIFSGKKKKDSNDGNDTVVENDDKGQPSNGNESGGGEDGDKGDTSLASYSSGSINTGNLTAKGNGYEGIEGTGDYNYGEALQKSLIFYEMQRSGDIDENNTRCNWRGDSALNDGSDAGVDLTGGWYDAGDHIKFNLPMAYSASMLGWSVIEDKKAYEESGQLAFALDNIRWANDYFIKCHVEDEVYYYQVGSVSGDHSWWGPAECVETATDRPSYVVTKDSPGSAVCAESAASLAIASIAFQDEDAAYSKECLQHAKSLYKFAEDTKSDAGYTAAAGCYDSWSGFYDELAWAGVWLYEATGDKEYLDKAKEYYAQAGHDYDWAMCWDDVHIGAAVKLAEVTKDKTYIDAVEKHLDYWTTGTSEGERITYTPKGLAWLDTWGSLRYATTTGFLAAVYSGYDVCDSSKKDVYWDFAVAQANYALGSAGRSYEIGFGEDYPVSPHHRTAQGSYCNNMNEPSEFRHTLYGALVGGPDASDNYIDEVSNYTTNEVACDYNAGFTGLLAKLYSEYHGKTLKDFGAVETPTCNELYVEGAVNVDGQDFIEIKAFVYNMTAWPARVPKNLELRYYVDLSEVYNAGKTASDIEITTNYMQAGNASSGLMCQDEDNHIYYLSIDFGDALIYPGGQDAYKKEIQVRMRNPEGAWDNSNDPSYACLNGNNLSVADTFALFEDGKLVFGQEPEKGKGAGTAANGGKTNSNSNDNNQNNNQNNNQSNQNSNSSGTAKSGDVELSIKHDGNGSISGEIKIKNISKSNIDIDDLTLYYYLTDDNNKDMVFECYNSAITSASGNYSQLSGVKGSFKSAKGTDADTVCEVTFGGAGTISSGDTLVLNFAIHYSDWSQMNGSNDYSGKKAENIVIKSGTRIIFGNEP